MKKIFLTLVILVLVLMTNMVFAEEAITVIVDDQALTFDVAPELLNGRLVLPLRSIFEALGLTVSYDSQTKTITGHNDVTQIQLVIDSPVALINKETSALDVPATILNGRTVVPTRFVAEATGAHVTWHGATRTVIIKSPEPEINYVQGFAKSLGLSQTQNMAYVGEFYEVWAKVTTSNPVELAQVKILMENLETQKTFAVSTLYNSHRATYEGQVRITEALMEDQETTQLRVKAIMIYYVDDTVELLSVQEEKICQIAYFPLEMIDNDFSDNLSKSRLVFFNQVLQEGPLTKLEFITSTDRIGNVLLINPQGVVIADEWVNWYNTYQRFAVEGDTYFVFLTDQGLVLDSFSYKFSRSAD